MITGNSKQLIDNSWTRLDWTELMLHLCWPLPNFWGSCGRPGSSAAPVATIHYSLDSTPPSPLSFSLSLCIQHLHVWVSFRMRLLRMHLPHYQSPQLPPPSLSLSLSASLPACLSVCLNWPRSYFYWRLYCNYSHQIFFYHSFCCLHRIRCRRS